MCKGSLKLQQAFKGENRKILNADYAKTSYLKEMALGRFQKGQDSKDFKMKRVPGGRAGMTDSCLGNAGSSGLQKDTGRLPVVPGKPLGSMQGMGWQGAQTQENMPSLFKTFHPEKISL